jgi:hypothetical protein
MSHSFLRRDYVFFRRERTVSIRSVECAQFGRHDLTA